MMKMKWTAARSIALIAVVLAAAGCENKATKEKLAQLTTVSAEKDSLLAIMSENTRLLSDISSELAKVKEVRRPVSAVKASESPLASSVSYRDSIKTRIGEVVIRVNQAESRLAAAQRRIKGMGAFSDSIKAQLASAEQSMGELRTNLEAQKKAIEGLETQVNDLKGQNTQLAVEKAALTDTLKTAVTDNNTVYYVIGTKDELKEKGIIQEEGSKFLIFGAKTMVPGWNLDPTAFTKTDLRELNQIDLPKDDKWYKIVSRQNLQYLNGATQSKDGKVKGEAIHITEPSRFWATSPFLIIVEG